MKKSTKEKVHIENKPKKGKVLVKPIGAVETPSQIETELAERMEFWQEAIETLKSESFPNIEVAVDRVVELASKKMGAIAASKDTKEFMKDTIMDNEEILDVLTAQLKVTN
jgi:hypothetical protein